MHRLSQSQSRANQYASISELKKNKPLKWCRYEIFSCLFSLNHYRYTVVVAPTPITDVELLCISTEGCGRRLTYIWDDHSLVIGVTGNPLYTFLHRFMYICDQYPLYWQQILLLLQSDKKIIVFYVSPQGLKLIYGYRLVSQYKIIDCTVLLFTTLPTKKISLPVF